MPETAPKTSNPNRQHYVLKLFISGANRRSQRAIENLNQICEEYLQGQYDMEVVDLYRFPDSAPEAGILAAPTLIKEMPTPMRRLIGDLSQKDQVLLLLNLKRK